MNLISISKWYRDTYKMTRVRHDYISRWLDELAAQDDRFKFFKTEDDFYVASEETLGLLKEYLDKKKAAVSIATKEAEKLSPQAQAAAVYVTELLTKRIADLEDMVLEQGEANDKLYKAVSEMILIYEALRNATSDPKGMPNAPTLPPRYKHRILIVGGDYRVLERVAPIFKDIRFLHIEAGGAAGESSRKGKGTYPRADVVFLMTSFLGHGLQDAIYANYPKDIVHRITGSTGSLESAIHVWKAEYERGVEAKAKLQ